MRHALGVGRHHGSFVVQVIVFAVVAHDAQYGNALGDLNAQLAAGCLVAFGPVDKGMLGQLFLYGFGAYAVQFLPDGLMPFFSSMLITSFWVMNPA